MDLILLVIKLSTFKANTNNKKLSTKAKVSNSCFSKVRVAQPKILEGVVQIIMVQVSRDPHRGTRIHLRT